MRTRLVAWLIGLVRWLGGQPDIVYVSAEPGAAPELKMPKGSDPVVVAAITLVETANGMAPGTSGDYKRAFVYNQLQRAFPKTRKRDLAYAIERVIQARP